MKKNHDDVSILLVEDDDIDARAVKRGLSRLKLGNPLYRAKNGVEAFNLLQTEGLIKDPYIILLDLNMPIMGGLEFLNKVRKNAIFRSAVIFVLTTSSADEDLVAAYQENVAGYIVKSDVKDGFENVFNMLEHYWDVVALPTTGQYQAAD